MKNAAVILVLTMFSYMGCAPQKSFVKNPPFEVGEAVCYNWVGGRAESGKGTVVSIPLSGESIENITFKQLFFRGKATNIKLEKIESGWVAKGNFYETKTEKPDRIMHSDAEKEVGNQPPMIPEKIPFELADNEGVISYIEGEIVKYVKLKDVKETKQKIRQ
ncbi:hypothetical protein GCM10011414_05710 [Croceivirga lutea]|uniref:hypothetical protein n=1 Tax=Croceivirga lutea TaxID=1775167 RepID=UPI00163A5C25|nr:hypothetical protein [Croceivirga lutea]GGG39221.1 hypothetical protein GCM10011414_05710 [Croceivirga lutea]